MCVNMEPSTAAGGGRRWEEAGGGGRRREEVGGGGRRWEEAGGGGRCVHVRVDQC